MIKTIKQGDYKLLETKNQSKILILDNTKGYAWINAAGIGEILVATRRTQETDTTLAVGKYRLYEVKDEPKISDLVHLELMAGQGVWQGYLLLTELPTDKKSKSRIIPTTEVITKTTEYSPIGQS